MLGKLRNFCTRETIFLSYSSKDSAIAEDIAQALKVEGHKVFFDKSSLEAGDGFGEQIRASIRKSDRFIFLVSRHSLLQSAYVKNELQQAESKWPSATRAVLPVQIDTDAPMDQLPPYLKVRHVHKIEGHVPAGVAALVAKTGTVRPRCFAIAATLVLCIVLGVWLVTNSVQKSAVTQNAAVDIVLGPWRSISFEPLKDAPKDASVANADRSWTQSETTITIHYVSYNVRSKLTSPPSLLDEEIDLYFGDRVVRYQWRNRVDVASDGCKTERCIREPLSERPLQQSGVSEGRSTIYQSRQQPPSWREFYEYYLTAEKPMLRMVLRATLDVPAGPASKKLVLERTCYFTAEAEAHRAAFRANPKNDLPRYLDGTLTQKYLVWTCREQP